MKQYDGIKDEELISRFKNGESEILDYLMEKYKNMVRKKARTMFLIGGENDDLIQEGMIGLFKALQGAKYVAKFIFHSRRAGNRTGASGTG